MARTIWDPEIRTSIADRAQRVTAESMPRWGKFNATGMMAHVNDCLRMALGDLPVKPKKMFLRYKPVRKLIIYYLPMPKGAPTAPELIERCGTAVLEDEKKAFIELMTRVGAVPPGTKLNDHPAFGDLSYDEYGALIAKHTDHHLKQFGI